jgi:2',3'-cyclic-nucleotide 2'-phosphodiesterase (5'-nucleotidase family)
MVKKYIFFFLFLEIYSLSRINKKNLKSKDNEIRELKEEKELSDDIIILHTNDVHCGVLDSIGYDGLMLYKKDLQKQYKHVLTVDVGDHIQGGPLGLLSKGLDIIKIMNKIGYDVSIIGNHEFDYGIDQLKKCNESLNCGYISGNFLYRKNRTLIYPPYKLIQLDDIKIAFIGITTPQTLSKTILHTIIDEEGEMVYDFLTKNDGQELYEIIQKYINEVKDKGAKYVIILSHLGIEGDALEKYTSSGLLSHLIGVDAILDGHTHRIYNKTSKDKNGNDILLSQTGTKLTNLGVLKIKKNGEIISEMLSQIPTPKFIKAKPVYRDRKLRLVDPEMNNFINNIESSHFSELNKKIGYVNFDLLINSEEQSSRSGENPLCNLIADSIRYYGKGDITMINAGSIRNDLKKGDITFQNILEVLPFSAYIITKEVKGEDILNALEFGMKDLPEKTSRFPQVSGISFKVNTKIKSTVIVDEEEMFVKVSGKRRVYDVIVGKDKLDINKTYLIAFDNYIGKGGDGFSMFINYEEKLNLGKTDNELFMMYIRDVLNGVIPDEYKKTQQRIIIEENE